MKKKMRNINKSIIFISIMVLTLFEGGCGAEKKAGEEEPTQLVTDVVVLDLIDQGDMDVLELINRGDVKVEEIVVTDEGFGTSGEIFSVAIRNMSNDALEVEIPCGMVFTPNDSSLQPMMVIQKDTASVDPGKTTDLSPYVVCIDASAGIPEADDTYTIGYMEGGDLLSFAECLCEDPDTTTDPMGVQFAVWMVSDDINHENLSEFSGEAFQSLFGDQMGEYIPDEVRSMLENALGLSGDGGSEGWLARCGIR